MYSFSEKGGNFVALKAAAGPEELKEANKAIKTLGGSLKEEYAYHLPIEDSERTIYIINKLKETPKKYPRKPGIPNKNPIQ